MRILKFIGWAILALVATVAVILVVRTEPIGPLAGGELRGEERSAASGWGACEDHTTVFVEVRPEDPHSVTTLCFVDDGDLIIPAMDAGAKDWPSYAVADPRMRIKIGDAVYAGTATRDTSMTLASARDAIVAKYPDMADRDPAALNDVWFFRVTPRG